MEKVCLGKLFSVSSGDGIAVGELTSFGKYPVYGGNGITGFTEKYNVNNGTMIIGRVGEKCGNVFITTSNSWISDNALIVRKNVKYSDFYMMYLLEYINLNSYANRNAQPVISGKIIYDIEVPYTDDDEEQLEIAEVLSSFDTCINDLEELIEKKKAIRDGALEDLISGKIRLDGFDGEWKAISFDQYFTLLPTNTYSREQLSDSGAIGNIHYGDILIKYGCVLSENDYIPRLIDKSKLNARQYLKKNDVIIADTAEDETVGKSVQVGDIDMPLVSGLHTMACRPNYATADGYLGYYINSNCFHDQILPYVTGIKVSSISKKSIRETELYIPVNIEEQHAIASVLTAMDEEIESLKTEKEKMMEIREGAIDDLLTGRVHLKI